MTSFPRPVFRVLLVLAAAVAVPVAINGRQAPQSLQAAIDKIDAMVAAEQAKDNVGSVTAGVVHGSHLVWTRSYGFADAERKVPATKETVYRIGSITKQFTAVMLLQLVQDGIVRLSDPVERYLPEINLIAGRPAHAQPITLLQLATMTAGLAREPANFATYLVGPVERWEDVLMGALRETQYEHEPGTQYLYSNIGYAILGAALGRAAKTSYTVHVGERVLTPLGMSDTTFEPTPAITPRIAKGYEIDREGRASSDTPHREHQGRGYKVPNGAMYTTVGDLARFVAFELGEGPESVLKRSTLQDQHSRAFSATGNLDSGYGLGFQITRRGEHVFHGHSGSVAGYTAQAWVHLPSKTGFIVLRSAAGGKFQLGPLAYNAMSELAKAGTAK
jgi:CubicO group peptidase (beta-lactamase class C family)